MVAQGQSCTTHFQPFKRFESLMIADPRCKLYIIIADQSKDNLKIQCYASDLWTFVMCQVDNISNLFCSHTCHIEHSSREASFGELDTTASNRLNRSYQSHHLSYGVKLWIMLSTYYIGSLWHRSWGRLCQIFYWLSWLNWSRLKI